MELHQNVEKFLHLHEKVVENSRLAPQFLPSPRPNLPAITDSPEGGANLLVGGANLLVTAVFMQSCEIVVRLGSTEIAHISNSSDISNLEVFLDSFVFLDAPTDKFDLNVILANELLAKFLCRFKVVPEPKHQVETFNIIFFVHSYLIISYTNDPPGDFCTVRLGSSVGYQGIPLDPQGPKMGFASRISGPDQRGRLRQVPGGPEPGHHQGLISGQSS